ncbi:MAG: hypothetical protein AAGM67_07815 [Bacteroidota bacterium]
MKRLPQLWICLSVLSIGLFSCQREEVQAINSLEGNWNITAITSYYGEFDETAFNPTETVEEAGQLGTMQFEAETVRFNFSRNDSLFAGNSDWALEFEKVNEGFFRVPRYTLFIDALGTFEVQFEDDTKNAQRDAQNAIFREVTDTPQERIVHFTLEKVE